MKIRASLAVVSLLVVWFRASAGLDGLDFGLEPASSLSFPCPTDRAGWLAKWKAVAEAALREPNDLHACFEKSKKLFENDPELAGCFSYHRKMAEGRYLASLGLDGRLAVSQKQYLDDSKPYVDVPKDLRDQKFLDALARADLKTADDFLKALNEQRRKKKLPSYDFAAFDGSADPLFKREGYRRYMVYDPGGETNPRTEKWINFTLPEKESPPGSSVKFRQLSVVALHIDEKGVGTTYFADHEREYKYDGKVTIMHNFERGSLDVMECGRCHRSGSPLAIRGKVVHPRYQKMLDSLNEPMLHAGITLSKHWDKRLLKAGMTIPPKGKLPLERIVACYPGGSNESLRNVAKAIRSCGRCHDGNDEGKLPERFGQRRDDKLANWVKLGHMPPDIALSEVERNAVVKCLSQFVVAAPGGEKPLAYYWMTGADCTLLTGREKDAASHTLDRNPPTIKIENRR